MPRLSPGDLYRLAVPGDPRLRPDGGAVAYVLTTADREADENRSEIWLAAPGAEPRRLTTGPRDAAPRWAPDGRTLAFLREVDGRPQVHLLPMDGGMDGGEPWALTSAPLGAGVPVWSPDGRTIAYAAPCGEVDPHAPVVADALDYKADGAGLLRGLRTHLFSCDVATGETTRLTEGDFHAGEPSWSADGRRLAFVADMRPDRDLKPGAAVYEVAAAGGGPVRLTGEDVVCAAAWWLDGRLVVAGWAGGDLVSHTRLFRLEAGGLEEIAPELDRNVMTGAPGYPGAAPQPLDGGLLFCARDGGCTHLYLDGKKLVGGDRVVCGMTAAAGRIAYLATTPYSVGDLILRDATGEETRLASYALEGAEPYLPRARVFTAPDGRQVEGFVLRDESIPGPGPLLLDVHGGPHNAWAPVFDAAHLYHQALAAKGWTVLTVNPRGSDGYGEEFYTAARGAWGLADAGDLLAPVEELVAEGVADPERLAVTGYSYGGYMACMLPAMTGRFRAAVAGGCVSDLAGMAGTSDLGHFLVEHECGGAPERQSPVSYLDEVRTPTLLLHGLDDVRCPPGQAERWFAGLRERGVPARLVLYPGASHLFILNGRPSHRLDYNERIIAWLEQWIPDAGPDGSPS